MNDYSDYQAPRDEDLRQRVCELTDAGLSGEATGEEAAELEWLVAQNDRACEFYVQLVHDASSLREWADRAGEPAGTLMSIDTDFLSRLHAEDNPKRNQFARPLGLTAAAALIAVAVSLYFFVLNPKHTGPDFVSVIEPTDGLTVEDDGTVELSAGKAELRLSNRVAVNIEGKTRLTLHGPMSTTLAQGKVTFDCPPQAKGYTVQLPGGAHVVDLGTRFSVDVESEGQSTVRVLEGEVEIIHSRTRRSLIANSSARLVGDRIVQLTDAGTILQNDSSYIAWDTAANFTLSDKDRQQAHWQVVNDGRTLGGRALSAESDIGGEIGDTATWTLRFTAAGTYHFYAHSRGPDGGSDTMYRPSDFGDPFPDKVFGNGSKDGSFGWRESESYTVSADQVGTELTFSIRVREIGYAVERLVLHKKTGLTATTLDSLSPSN